MQKGMKEIPKHLYRSLRRKARLATKNNHLFRFQSDIHGELWGKYQMYPNNYDKNILQNIFPGSIHEFLDNKYPFYDTYKNLNIKYNMNITDAHKSLYYEYEPNIIPDPNNPIMGDYGDNRDNNRAQKLPTPNHSPLANNVITEYDYYRLKRTIYNIFRYYNNINNHDNIQSLINDGFSILKEFDRQIEINECTSISEAHGLRIIVTSNHIPSLMPPEKKKPYGFTYRIRVENHGYSWVQLVGRHWLIKDDYGNQEQVPRFQPGVVGVQPTISSGQIFIYGSGVFLSTKNGEMNGAFQFTNINGELFEVGIAPFKLIANQENRTQ